MAAGRRRIRTRVRGARCRRTCATRLCCAVLAALLAVPSAVRADAASRDAALTATVAALAGTPVIERLRGVNRFFNTFIYRADREVWGRADHWASPAELIERGAGDCEDFAIAKYFTLRRLGLEAASLRLTYVRSLRSGSNHMVLLYLQPGAAPLVLDSLRPGLAPLTARSDLAPIYGVNEEHVTISVPGGGERSFPHAGRWVVSRWQKLLVRSPVSGVPARAAVLVAAADVNRDGAGRDPAQQAFGH